MSSRRVDSNILEFLYFELQVFRLCFNSYDCCNCSDCQYRLLNRKAPSTAKKVIIQHYNTCTRNGIAQLSLALRDDYKMWSWREGETTLPKVLMGKKGVTWTRTIMEPANPLLKIHTLLYGKYLHIAWETDTPSLPCGWASNRPCLSASISMFRPSVNLSHMYDYII